jgi:hypothetical protein
MTPIPAIAILAVPTELGSEVMPTSREILFREKLPIFTDTEAATLFYEYGEIVSVAGRDGPLPGTYLVSFASEKGLKAGPLVLNSVVARALCKLLLDGGFGPLPPK